MLPESERGAQPLAGALFAIHGLGATRAAGARFRGLIIARVTAPHAAGLEPQRLGERASCARK